MRLLASSSSVLLLALASPAFAQQPPVSLTAGDEEPIHYKYRWPVMALEMAAWMAPPTLYYYGTLDKQREDFELDWDKESWKQKLTTFDTVVFDTGNWNSNAFRHPVFGAISYQIARTNGFSPFAATMIDFVTAAVWEYVVEYRELVSLNDLMVNTVSGFMIGEPLFQIGRTGDHKEASWARKSIAGLSSPLHRIHSLAGYPGWRKEIRPWTDFELGLGGAIANHEGTLAPEGEVDVELELIREARYGLPGTGTQWTGLAAFNRVAGGIRFTDEDASRSRFETSTTFFGVYSFIGLGTGFDYETRKLAMEWDRFGVFHLLGPRIQFGAWRGTTHITWDASAALDLGMIQAHVFGPVLPFPEFPQTSVLQSRGYYFGGGTSAVTRLRVDTPVVTGELEARAYQLWSIDGRARMEDGPGADDPRDVSDRRLSAAATAGVRPGLGATRFEVSIEGAIRKGWWQASERTTTELTTGAKVVLPF
jgi:hypothetical protein